MDMKLDMSKAYDRIKWEFLVAMRERMEFPKSSIDQIMKCAISPNIPILVNGHPIRKFSLFRWLRQGDPLFPFLFIFCVECLSALLKDVERMKKIHGINLGKRLN